jgi:hypothetical protein
MADMTMILPYDRASPLHIPTRDLVLSAADSIDLTVTIVESDDPSAQAIVLTGGIGGPACTLLIWPEHGYRHWDYGAETHWPRTALWMGVGTISDAIGSFAISMPAATMASWPRRCAWAVLLDFDGGGQCEMVASGHLHIRPSATRPTVSNVLLTDDGTPILLDGIS